MHRTYQLHILIFASILPAIRLVAYLFALPTDLDPVMAISRKAGEMVGVVILHTLIALIVFTISKRKLKGVTDEKEQVRILKRARRNGMVAIVVIYVFNVLTLAGQVGNVVQ